MTLKPPVGGGKSRVNEWFIESFIQTIRSTQLIHLKMKQVVVFMKGSLNHWLKWFVQKHIHLGTKHHFQFSLELFSLAKQKKTDNSFNINVLFFELLYKMSITFAIALKH